MIDDETAYPKAGAVEAIAGGLRRAVLTGGAFLFGRQLFSMALSLVGLLLITRIIGPARFGAYAAAIGVYLYLQNFCQMGIGVFLVRSQLVTEDDLHVSWWLLLAVSLAMVGGLEAAVPLISSWVKVPGFGPLMAAMALVLPFQMVAVTPTSMLERKLDYRKVATIETVSQLAFYVFAIPAVLLGRGAWALAGGWGVQQFLSCVLFHIAARCRPKPVWSTPAARAIVGYASGLSAAAWIWQLRVLINPLIIGHVLGAAAVGELGIAVRIVEMLAFARGVVWRLSVSALARIQAEPGKLREAMTLGTELQTLAVAPIMLAFSLVGGILAPIVFGARFSWTPVLVVFPYLALAQITNIQFTMQCSVLFIFRKNLQMALFHSLNVIAFALVAAIAAPHFGLIAYGWGEVAGFLAYLVLYFAVQQVAPPPQYGLPALWWTGFAIGLFWRELGAWALAAPVVALLWPPPFQELTRLTRLLLSHVYPKPLTRQDLPA